MNLIFDKNKINQIVADFYKSTGVAVALYDSSMEPVAGSPAYSGCCALIRSKSECRKNCDRSNLIHMKEVSQNPTVSSYTCHGGLMETILPILYDGVIIAYMQIGQFRDEEEVYSSPETIKSTANKYSLDADELLSLYNGLTVVSESKLRALCNIMDIVIKSLWEDGLITCNRSVLSVRIEKYIRDNITSKISIGDLCREFLLSKNSLYKLFREEFNSTINDYINECKLALAKKMLLSESSLNVTQIAYACGFTDYNYFIRLFRKHVGVTPMQFRRNNTD